jgi:hypothetical protein
MLAERFSAEQLSLSTGIGHNDVSTGKSLPGTSFRSLSRPPRLNLDLTPSTSAGINSNSGHSRYETPPPQSSGLNPHSSGLDVPSGLSSFMNGHFPSGSSIMRSPRLISPRAGLLAGEADFGFRRSPRLLSPRAGILAGGDDFYSNDFRSNVGEGMMTGNVGHRVYRGRFAPNLQTNSGSNNSSSNTTGMPNTELTGPSATIPGNPNIIILGGESRNSKCQLFISHLSYLCNYPN